MGSKDGLCLWCGRFTESRAKDGLAECERPECIENRDPERCLYCGAELDPATAVANPDTDIWGHPDERFCNAECIEAERLER